MNPLIIKLGRKNAEKLADDLDSEENDGLQAFAWFFGLTIAFMIILGLCGILL